MKSFDVFYKTITESPDDVMVGKKHEGWGETPNITVIMYPNGGRAWSKKAERRSQIHISMNATLRNAPNYSEEEIDALDLNCNDLNLCLDGSQYTDEFSPHGTTLCGRYFPESKVFSWWTDNSELENGLEGYTEDVYSFLTKDLKQNIQEVMFDNSSMDTYKSSWDMEQFEKNNGTTWNPEMLRNWNQVKDGNFKEDKTRDIDKEALLQQHLLGKDKTSSPYREAGKEKMKRKDPLFYQQYSTTSESHRKPSVIRENYQDHKNYYHVTPAFNITNIIKNGLTARRGTRSLLAKEKGNRIYLFDSKADVENALANWLGDEFPDTDLKVVTLSLPKDFPLEKEAFEVTTTKDIPPHYITNIEDEY